MNAKPLDRSYISRFWGWLTRDESAHVASPDKADSIDWVRCSPFIAMHVGCAAALYVGVSPIALAVAAFLFLVRMFFITAFYHRYFSHRTFKTSRAMQFIFGMLACTAGQRGPLWWAAHHRRHHKYSDEDPDVHSPNIVGFLKAHMGWFMTPRGFVTDERYVRDWARYPELRWLNRLDWLPLLALAAGTYGLGVLLSNYAPSLGTNGLQMFVWGWVISTVVLYHATYTINSLAHRFGSQRFVTGDDSRNNFLLAIVTLGEGWHNNHHHYPASARQGFYWWEIDLTYYGLLLLNQLRVIRDLRAVPEHALTRGRISDPNRSDDS